MLPAMDALIVNLCCVNVETVAGKLHLHEMLGVTAQLQMVELAPVVFFTVPQVKIAIGMI